MLRSLYIKNYALLDEVKVEFGEGLNIITGETGAGKSILIGALGMILGDKADPSTIRKGSDKALVEGYFDVSRIKDLRRRLVEIPEPEEYEHELILRREIHEAGRSRAFINDSPVATPVIQKLGDQLIDLHGQHQHQSLLKTDQHLEYLDDFGGLHDLVRETETHYRRLRELQAQLKRLKEKDELLREKRELLEFQSMEISQADPQPDEEEQLEREAKILRNSEKLYELTSQLLDLLYTGEGSVSERLSTAENFLGDLAQIDNNFDAIRRECVTAGIHVEEIIQFLQKYHSSIEFDPQRLEEIQARLGLFSRLKKKYGGSIAEVIAYKEKIDKDLQLIENVEEDVATIEEEIEKERHLFSLACQKLSQQRKKVSQDLGTQVERVLAELGMDKARFQVRTKLREQQSGLVEMAGKKYWANDKGMDLVEFYISTNPGEDLKPLAKVASGGEISRIMLALKSILADRDKVPILIFDEIDLGISGRIAQVVGRSLKNLSASHQIICITHLPQIASMADTHFVVEKRVLGERTITTVKKLQLSERTVEIAKLLGGERISETHLKSAQELLEEARKKASVLNAK